MISKKIAFIYGYEPSGHSVAAKALAQALPEKKDYIFINLSEIYSAIGPLVASAYFKLVQKTPLLWGYLYDSPYLSAAHKNFKNLIPKIFFYRLKKIISENQIDAIISTHAFASLLVSKEYIGLNNIKRGCVLTDFYPHSFWDSCADMYFAPSNFTAKKLSQKISKEKIFTFGLPLRKELIQSAQKEPYKNKIPVFLLTGGNRGFLAFEEIKKAFIKTGKKAHLNIMCAENQRLKKHDLKSADITFSFIPYKENPAELYRFCDCVIGKPGGLTIFETALFKKPFIAHSPLPGQEERNLNYLLKSQKCFFAENSDKLSFIIELFYKNKKAFSLKAQNLSSLADIKSSQKIINSFLG
ncbi:MAG: glycosyltransferase [Elusimicrobiota bacterium]